MTEKDPDVSIESLRDIVMPTKPLKKNKAGRIQAMKELIELNKGKVLKGSDFSAAAQTQSAPIYLKELLDNGCIERTQADDGAKGHRYMYTWIKDPEATASSPETFSDSILEMIEEEASTWMYETAYNAKDKNELAEKHQGVIDFIKHLKNKHNNVTSEDK